MRIRIAALACVLALAPAAALAIQHATSPINPQTRDSLIPAGTLIRIRMLQTISSSFSHAGDPFSWVVSDDVMIGKRVAIAAGTKGVGRIARVIPAHGGRSPGFMRLNFYPITLTDGTTVDIGITHESLVVDANDKNGYGGAVEEVANMTIPYLFILDALRKGDDMTIRENAVFHVGVLEDAFVSADAVAVSATPLPPATPTPPTEKAPQAPAASASPPPASAAPAPPVTSTAAPTK